tara:strand:- start:110 stop:403 length:294 start_codon:yes stop_codon:yes gene_type:complete
MYTKSESWYEKHFRLDRHSKLERERTDYQVCIENQCLCGRIFSKKAYFDRHYKKCPMNRETMKKAREARRAELKKKQEEMEQQRLDLEKLLNEYGSD